MRALLPALLAVGLAAAGPEEPLAEWALAEPGRVLDGLAASPDGRCVAVRVTGGGADALAVVDVRAGVPVARVSVGPGPLGAPLWLAADRLAVAAPDGLWVFRIAGGTGQAASETPSLPRRGQGEVQSNRVAWIPPEVGAMPRLLASDAPSGTSPCPLLGKEGVLRFTQQADEPGPPVRLPADLLPNAPAAASGDGRRVAAACAGGALVMDVRTGVVVGRLAVRPERLTALLLDADGETAVSAEGPVASVAPGGILTVWKVSTGGRLAAVSAASADALAAAGEGTFWGAGAGELTCRRAPDLALLARWGAPAAKWLAVSPDGATAALAAGTEVTVVRLEDGAVRQVFQLREPCGGLAFCAPDRLAVATGRHLWSLRTPTP